MGDFMTLYTENAPTFKKERYTVAENPLINTKNSINGNPKSKIAGSFFFRNTILWQGEPEAKYWAAVFQPFSHNKHGLPVLAKQEQTRWETQLPKNLSFTDISRNFTVLFLAGILDLENHVKCNRKWYEQI